LRAGVEGTGKNEGTLVLSFVTLYESLSGSPVHHHTVEVVDITVFPSSVVAGKKVRSKREVRKRGDKKKTYMAVFFIVTSGPLNTLGSFISFQVYKLGVEPL
jgi:hypothetical protein